MYKICFYVPNTHLEEVKNALFAQGAGKIGGYSHYAWQILGEGQFLPLANSNPFIGTQNQLEKVSEYKVEMICNDQYIQAAIAALKKSHPYEEPAYQVWRLETL
ncbi:MAG TPA: NGG1p interacting factor NIF3 [Gammaproteobacteria bacterium]|nr:NGG1p interacting factor NIF3 [Gammaproteobacteria bacterium]